MAAIRDPSPQQHTSVSRAVVKIIVDAGNWSLANKRRIPAQDNLARKMSTRKIATILNREGHSEK